MMIAAQKQPADQRPEMGHVIVFRQIWLKTVVWDRSAPRPPQTRSFRPVFWAVPPLVLGRSAPMYRHHMYVSQKTFSLTGLNFSWKDKNGDARSGSGRMNRYEWYECPARACFIQAHNCRVSRLVKTSVVKVSRRPLRQHSSEVDSMSETIPRRVLTAQLTVDK